MPGVSVDTLLCVLLWRARWTVLLMPHGQAFGHAVTRSKDEQERSNTGSTVRWNQYAFVHRHIKLTYLYNRNDTWRDRTLKRIRHLNREHFKPCEMRSTGATGTPHTAGDPAQPLVLPTRAD